MILGRYIFREIVVSALLGTALATAVIFLQGLGKLFEPLVRGATDAETIGYLLLLAVPPLLPLTIPFGVLVGILIGLGRMSSDGEIIAMRSAGVSTRSVLKPVLFFAILGTAAASYASLKLTPWAWREQVKVINRIYASQLTAEIQPRVFEEQFPNTILYVGDVRPGNVVLWRNVFMADLTPPEQRQNGLQQEAEGPRVTVAREAIAVPDLQNNRIQLSMRDASTHEVDKAAQAFDTTFPKGEQAIQASPPSQARIPPFRQLSTGELRKFAAGIPGQAESQIEAQIELQRRWALPLACLMMAFIGVPLGVASRKGGKSAGYIMAIFLAFFCYHLASISLVGLAKQRTLPVEVAVWLPNAAFAIAGIVLMLRMEQPGERDIIGRVRGFATGLYKGLQPKLSAESAGAFVRGGRLPLLPQIVDTYVLSTFLFYFFLLLATFVLMTQIYNFFELLGDVVRNKIAMTRVFTFLLFLTPKLIYDTLPISVLVAVLVTFGVLSKQNEVTAFRACGVSLHRLSAPILIASAALSGGLFLFDHYYIPEANRIQDGIRNEIKGRPPQTYLRPDRKWIFGQGNRIYYYRFFEPAYNVMGDVRVFELEPNTFRLLRQIQAERAVWEPRLKTWIFQNGWRREVGKRPPDNFERFDVKTFPNLIEPPYWFLRELKQDKQMNFRELERYIAELQQSGFDTVRLRVQFYKKFAVPLFAAIMALIAIPFAFAAGNRGAMTGIGVSIGIAIVYWSVGLLFEQFGNANQLPPAIAAWAPDALFSVAGLYLMLRLRS